MSKSEQTEKLAKVRRLIELQEKSLDKLRQLEVVFLCEAGLWSMELETMTKDMALPEKRRRDLRWLARNLPIRNRTHPFCRKAMDAIKELLT